MEVSVIIPTLKAEEELAELVSAMKATACYDVEVIVVAGPASSAANRNTGLDKAKGEFIIMCDDDTGGYTQDWDKGLINALEQTGASVVSARLMNQNGSIHACNHGNNNVSRDFVNVSTIPASCCAFHKTPLRFDEGFIGGGFEDTDFFRCMGGPYVIANTVRVIHRQEGTYTSVPHNRAYYNNKWGQK